MFGWQIGVHLLTSVGPFMTKTLGTGYKRPSWGFFHNQVKLEQTISTRSNVVRLGSPEKNILLKFVDERERLRAKAIMFYI